MTDDDSPACVIRCWEHGGDIASADTWDEARELAEENGAYLHPESGDWLCEPCYQKEMAYWSRMAPVLRTEDVARQQTQAMDENPIAGYLRAKGRI